MIDVELKKFIERLNTTNRESAARTYLYVLSPFTLWLEKRNKNLSTFTTADADEYFRNIENANSANMFLASLKSLVSSKILLIPDGDPQYAIEHQRYTKLKAIRAKPTRAVRKKVALTPNEVAELLHEIQKKKKHELLFAGTALCFLWGARPIEQEYFMLPAGIPHHAEYRWDKNEMLLWSAKVHTTRFLAWNDKFTPYVKLWVKELPFTTPGKYLTSHLNKYEIGGVKITARVGRKSVQTNLTLGGVDAWIINAILSHTDDTEASTYTDYTMYESKIKDVFVNKHYMNELI